MNFLKKTLSVVFISLIAFMNVSVANNQNGSYPSYWEPDGSDELSPISPFTFTGTAPVDSVNGEVGVVVLDQDDILDGTTNKQFSATEQTKLAGIEDGAKIGDTLAPATSADDNIAVWDGINSKTLKDGGTPIADLVNVVTSVFTRTGDIVATLNDYIATLIGFTPFGNIASTTVQGGMEELETEKMAISDYDPTAVSGDAFSRPNHFGTFSQDNSTTSSDPALNVAVSISNIDNFDGVFITLTTAGNDQTLQTPTDTTAGKNYLVSNVSSSTSNINVNGYVLEPSEYNIFTWDGASWNGNNIASQFSINNSGTGLYEGGELSIDVDTTKFDLSAGDGIIIDNTTNHEKPDIIRISWSAFNAQTITSILTSPVSYIAINSSGAIVQQTTPFSSSQYRSLIVIGSLGHTDNTNVTSFVGTPRVAIDQVLETSDLVQILGTISSGNSFLGSIGDLNIDKSEGSSFREGANFSTDKASPNITTDASDTSTGFAYGWRDGSGGTTIGAGTLNIDPANYDDGTGTLASVGANNFTIQRIFFFPGSGSTFIAYGQTVYNNFTGAKQALGTDPFDTPDAAMGSYLATRLILRNNIASFSDTVTDDTSFGFFQSGLLGDPTAGASAATTTLQQAYNNSSQPQITTTGGLGSIQFKGGTGTNTDNTVEWLNNAGATTTSIDGNGLMSIDVIQELTTSAGTTFNDDVIVSGDLTVNGTTTTLDTSILDVLAKVITAGNVVTPTDVTADAGGFTLKGATDKIIQWLNVDDRWHFNQGIEVDTGDLIVDGGSVGIGTTSPEGTLHVHTATAGVVTANTAADDLIVESSGNGGLSILTPDASLGSLIFGSPGDNFGAKVNWKYDDDLMIIATGKAGAEMQFKIADESDAMRIDSAGNVGIGTTNPLYPLQIDNITPAVMLRETDAAADTKFWNMSAGGGDLSFSTRNDANNDGNSWLTVMRTGIVVDAVAFPNGNVGIGTSSFGTSAVGNLAIGIGTAPTSNPADVAHMWVADASGAGTASVFVETEDGTITDIGNPAGGASYGDVLTRDADEDGFTVDVSGNADAKNMITVIADGANSSQRGVEVQMDTTGTGRAFNAFGGSSTIERVTLGSNLSDPRLNSALGFTLLYTESLGSNRTGSVVGGSHSRTNTGATSPSDNFDMVGYIRTSVSNNGSSNFTSAGSVMKLTNVATETLGTLTDTAIILEGVQDVDSTGDIINMKLGSTEVFVVEDDGKIVTGGADPVISTCGTTPAAVGSDTAGKVTIGTGATTSCTVTFAVAYGNAPACTIAGDNTAVTYAATTSTTVLTITSSADMASDVISFICIGL